MTTDEEVEEAFLGAVVADISHFIFPKSSSLKFNLALATEG